MDTAPAAVELVKAKTEREKIVERRAKASRDVCPFQNSWSVAKERSVYGPEKRDYTPPGLYLA
jgi:uncharacterized protein (DUF169 family)